MATVSISIRGLDEAKALLDRLRLDAFQHDLLSQIGVIATRRMVERFESKMASPDGEPRWAALSPNTRRKRGHGPLVDTGRLMGSIGAVVSGNQVAIGTNVFDGTFDQHGTRKMPQRGLLGFGSADVKAIEDVVEDFVSRMLR
jgi:phage gpG-like protein